ncbi:MAG: hypothetical protein PHP10_02200 [Candidatus Omnitrophica bacterium]|nr:hypothetical protein [Candidatus Omnitrophota bacterium]
MTGIIHPCVVIIHAGHSAILLIVLVCRLTHSAYAHFSFSSPCFLNYHRVLAYAYCRKYAYDDYYDDQFN